MIRWLRWKLHKWVSKCHCYRRQGDVWVCAVCGLRFYRNGTTAWLECPHCCEDVHSHGKDTIR